MNRANYTVESETNRIKEKRPDLCWMDIPAYKLVLASLENSVFKLTYHHHEDKVYICTYSYTVSPQILKEALENFRGKTYKTYKKVPFYRFYLQYATGQIYASYSKKAKPIFKMKKICPVRLGEYALEKAQKEVSKTGGDIFPNLIARTAIWAPESAILAQKESDLKYVRMRTGQKKGTQVGDFILDDNTSTNSRLKRAIKKYLHFAIPQNEYHVCHIWPSSHDDARYHSDLRNVVLLPRAIHSLSDYDAAVIALLRYRASDLFEGWPPADQEKPKKPKGYDDLPWLNLPHKTMDNAHNRTSVF